MNTEQDEYEVFVATLEKQHPVMFSQPYGGVAVGKGWWPIIQALCKNIDSWVKFSKCQPVVVEQIKEKFGGLRFYYSGGDQQISGMVRMAEAWADHSCEECGAPGRQRSGGWIRTLCDEHEAERQIRLNKNENQSSI